MDRFSASSRLCFRVFNFIAGANRIHRDATARGLERQRFGEADIARLRRRR